ncbi:MAG TPA: hypothetical protein VN612_07380 [Acidobacteriaceae bacterium]|nr:hypothetical protein [Acidobacteriaceae bacterium]
MTKHLTVPAFRTAILAVAATVAMAPVAPAALAQSQTSQTTPQQRSQTQSQDRNRANPADTISGQGSSTPHNWTTDQIVTATVHQAWILSGKDEANFFDIVKQLAEISAQNRNLVLPNDPAAGRRAGAYIKAQAKADHDQLLYAIVDKSVRMTGKPAPAVASNH